MHGNSGAVSLPDLLTARSDFRVGDVSVSPSTRVVEGPAGRVTIEPRVVQVLLALIDAGGRVVPRAALLEACWHNRFVGDDAVHRAIAEVRRSLREIQATGIAVETIPKTGWRLRVADELRPAAPQAIDPAAVPSAPPATAVVGEPPQWRVSRRALVAAGTFGLAGVGVAAWRWRAGDDEGRAAALLARAKVALRDSDFGTEWQSIGDLDQATALDPENAAAWGTLALAWRNIAENAEPANVAAAASSSKSAASRALALDPRQGDALAALATLTPIFGDWRAAEQRLSAVLAVAPANLDANYHMAKLMSATGLSRASLAITTWLTGREPLSPDYQVLRIYGLWAEGRIDEADRAVDRALQLWPGNPHLQLARLHTWAYSGRAAAAGRFVAQLQARQSGRSHILALLSRSMLALDTRKPADVAAAVAGNLIFAAQDQPWAATAILILGGLGAVDAAFDVAKAYFRDRPESNTDAKPLMVERRDRDTRMLFLPATTSLRADPRFADLCRDIGLTAYWFTSAQRPDFLGNSLLPV